MANEAMSMLNCTSKYKQGNPFGVPNRALDSNFSSIANGLGMDVWTDEFNDIEGIFRHVARKQLSIRQTCMEQQDSIPRIEEELRNRIPGIFSGPPPKVEKMLLAAYRIVAHLHIISRISLAKREKNRASFSSDSSNVLDLTQDSDSDASYIDTGDQDTESEFDAEGGNVERRKSVGPHKKYASAQSVFQTVATQKPYLQGVHRTESQVSKSNFPQSSLPTAKSLAMSRSDINRARVQWPLKYPYRLKAAMTGQLSKGRDKENPTPIGIISRSSGSNNAANGSVHRHREPLPDSGKRETSNGFAISTNGAQLPIIKQEEEPIIIVSSPPRSIPKNASSYTGARKLRPVPKVVITTKPSTSTRTPESTSLKSPILTMSVIERFLHACQPPMDRLLPLFQRSGCVTAAYLRSIAKRSPKERETLLRRILVQPGREGGTVVVGDIDIWMLDLHLASYDFGHTA